MKPFLALILLVFYMTLVLQAQSSEKQILWNEFRNDFSGQKIVKWNNKTNAPKRILGNDIFLEEKSINNKNIAKHTESFLKKYQALLNFRGSELRCEKIIPLEKYYLMIFQQYYRDVEVLNGILKVKVSPQGQITWINSQCAQDIQTSSNPGISLAEAKAMAVSHYAIKSDKYEGKSKLVVFYNTEKNENILCWQIGISSKDDDLNKSILLDANSGEIIYEQDNFLMEEIHGNVKIQTYDLPGMMAGTPDMTPDCPDLTVYVVGGNDDDTDQYGNYSITVPGSGNYNVEAYLQGPHACVINARDGGTDAVHQAVASTSSAHDWTWQGATHEDEAFVFYYLNKAWHEFTDHVSGSSPGWIIGYANNRAGSYFNTFMQSISIGQRNHYGGTVYHEYSHYNIFHGRNNSMIASGYTNSDANAMDEGFADYFSCSFTNDPVRYGTGRDLSSKLKYYPPEPPNDDNKWGHTRGQIIGGAVWELRNKSGMSVDYVNGLTYETILGLSSSDTFKDFFDDLLYNDDNDGNILNGTPHDDQIFAAFVNDHAIMGSYLTGGTITTDVTIYDDVTVIGSITIANGVTITIQPNVTLDFANSSQLIVNGTLNANDVSFTKNGATNWAGIRFNNGSSGTIQYSDINYADMGVYYNNTSTPVVTHCNINYSSTYGIYLYNNSSPELSYNIITGGSTGIYSYQSNPIISHTTVTGQSNTGVSCFDSDAYMANSGKGNNIIRQNYKGLASGYESVMYLSNGSNCVHNSSFYEVYCIFAVVNAEYVWWNVTTYPYYSNSDFWLEYTATVDANPAASSDPNGCSSAMFKYDDGSIVREGEIISEDITDILNYEQSGNYAEAIRKYKEKLRENKTDNVKCFILGRIAKCYLRSGKSDFMDFLNQEIKSKVKKENDLFGAALRAENIILRAQKKYDQVIKNLIFIRDNYSHNEMYYKTALYSLGTIYYCQYEDITKAKEYFAELLKNYPDDLLSENAKLLMGEESVDGYKNGNNLVKDSGEENELSDDFQLIGNYPNPFNPTTEIKFSVPVTSNVKLTIYNIMGQEIKTFESDGVSVGTHSFNWNGRNKNEEQVSSGIYIYRVRAIGSNGEVFERSAKMILLR